MPGTAKPPIVLAFDRDNNKKSKEEIMRRQEHDLVLGDAKMVIPPFIRRNKEARKKWDEIVNAYRKAGLALSTSTDVGFIARYCEQWAEYLRLIKEKEQYEVVELEFEEESAAAEMFLREAGQARTRNIMKKIDFLMTIDARMKLQAHINTISKALLSMEDKLFLTPLAKFRYIPAAAKPIKPKKGTLEAQGFGNL